MLFSLGVTLVASILGYRRYRTFLFQKKLTAREPMPFDIAYERYYAQAHIPKERAQMIQMAIAEFYGVSIEYIRPDDAFEGILVSPTKFGGTAFGASLPTVAAYVVLRMDQLLPGKKIVTTEPQKVQTVAEFLISFANAFK